jgi:hypothetical protein
MVLHETGGLYRMIAVTHGRASQRANQPNQSNQSKQPIQTVNQSQFYRQTKLIIFVHCRIQNAWMAL